ncbi:hypothetical protein TeGR_g768 [Tetraparma gracilis]|uniref:DNA-directed RNA polymerase n=1 Tax=Tetraparma gracilis TaxID=2962635 RepID=A0ABQ6N7E0_9STRA|nr:hypothetical protein TeGR_g768 [Tetraparma gracilis]
MSKIIANNTRIRDSIAASSAASGGAAAGDDSDDEDTRMQKVAAKASQTLQAWIDLQQQVNCYYDSSKDPGGTSANAPPGIRQLLERKEGIFRKHMMGKRVNYCCRCAASERAKRAESGGRTVR